MRPAGAVICVQVAVLGLLCPCSARGAAEYDRDKDRLRITGATNTLATVAKAVTGPGIQTQEHDGRLRAVAAMEGERLGPGAFTRLAAQDDGNPSTFAFARVPDREPPPVILVGGRPAGRDTYDLVFIDPPRRANYEAAETEIVVDGAGVLFKTAPQGPVTANYHSTVFEYDPSRNRAACWASRLVVEGELTLGNSRGPNGDYQNEVLEFEARGGDFANVIEVAPGGRLNVLDSEIRTGGNSRGVTVEVLGTLSADHALFSGAQVPVLQSRSRDVRVTRSTLRTGLSPTVFFHLPPSVFNGNYVETNDRPGITVTDGADGTTLQACEVWGFGPEYKSVNKPGIVAVEGKGPDGLPGARPTRLTMVNCVFPWETTRLRGGELTVCREIVFHAAGEDGRSVAGAELTVVDRAAQGSESPYRLKTDDQGLTPPIVLPVRRLQPRPADHPEPSDCPLELDASARRLEIAAGGGACSVDLAMDSAARVEVTLDRSRKVLKADQRAEAPAPHRPRLILYDQFNEGSRGGWRPLPGSRLSMDTNVCRGAGALRVQAEGDVETIGCWIETDFMLTDDTRFSFALLQQGDVEPLRAALQDASGEWYGDLLADGFAYEPRERWNGQDRLVTEVFVKPEMRFLSRGRRRPTAGLRIKAARFLQQRHGEARGAHSFVIDNVCLYDAFGNAERKKLFNPQGIQPDASGRFTFTLPEARKHPCLGTMAKTLERLRASFAKTPEPIRRQYIEPVEQWLEKAGPAGYTPQCYDPHYFVETFGYFCPMHSTTALGFDPARPHWHGCELCGKNYRGPTFQNIWTVRREQVASDIAYKAAWAYQLTGEKKYARLAQDILSKQVDLLLRSRRGRCFTGNRLVMETYDLLYDALSEADRRDVRSLLVPIRHIVPPEPVREAASSDAKARKVDNLAGHGLRQELTRAIFLEDRPYIGELLDSFQYALLLGVNEEGLWWEKSIDYHHFFLRGMEMFADEAQTLGIDFYHHPMTGERLRKSYEVELLLSMPNRTLPGFNDGAYFQGSRGGGLWTRYNDPRGQGTQPLSSVNLPLSRLAVLRSDAQEAKHQFYVCLDYSDYKTEGSHSHPDNLQTIIFAAGSNLMPDLGEIGYAAKEHFAWYNNVGSHNTLTIDAETIPRCPGGGRDAFLLDSPSLKLVSVEGEPEGGVTCRRTLALEASGAFLVDVFSARSDEPHIYDLKSLVFGDLALDRPLRASDGSALSRTAASGYPALQEVKTAGEQAAFQACWRLGQQQTRLTMPGGPPVRLFAARGFGKTNKETIDLLVMRRRAPRAVFATVLESFLDKGPEPDTPIVGRRIEKIEPAGDGFRVETATARHTYVARQEIAGKRQAGRLALDGEVGILVEDRRGQFQSLVLINGTNVAGPSHAISSERPVCVYLGREADGLVVQCGPQGAELRVVVPGAGGVQRIVAPSRLEPVRAATGAGGLSFRAEPGARYRIVAP